MLFGKMKEFRDERSNTAFPSKDQFMSTLNESFQLFFETFS